MKKFLCKDVLFSLGGDVVSVGDVVVVGVFLTFFSVAMVVFVFFLALLVVLDLSVDSFLYVSHPYRLDWPAFS